MKVVIFDMDGVLVDTELLYTLMYQEVYASFGLTLDMREREGFVGTSVEKVWQFVKDKYSLKESVDELIAMKDKSYLAKLHSLPEILSIDGVQDLLEYLDAKGYRLAIASSSTRELIEYITGKAGISRYFSFISSGDSVKKGKPDPEIFLNAASHYGARPDECFVIEDAASGVCGGKAGGMTVYAYRNPNSGNQDLTLADFVFDSFDDLKNLL